MESFVLMLKYEYTSFIRDPIADCVRYAQINRLELVENFEEIIVCDPMSDTYWVVEMRLFSRDREIVCQGEGTTKKQAKMVACAKIAAGLPTDWR